MIKTAVLLEEKIDTVKFLLRWIPTDEELLPKKLEMKTKEVITINQKTNWAY